MPDRTCTIFYSWQSQLPNATNRGFIEKALEVAVRAVRDDATIDVRPDVDKDTANVPGSPNIADTIRAKIDAAEIVICDVSIVQGLGDDGERVRPTPNANVLIELGYAMKSLGTMERLVLVMNTAYGGIDKLPFDLRQYRPATYHLPEDTAADRGAVRRELASKLENTLRHVLMRPSRHAEAEALDNGSPTAFRKNLALIAAEADRMVKHAEVLNVNLQMGARGSTAQYLPLMFQPAIMEAALPHVLGELDGNDGLSSSLALLRGGATAADKEAERILLGVGDARRLLPLVQNVLNSGREVSRLIAWRLSPPGG